MAITPRTKSREVAAEATPPKRTAVEEPAKTSFDVEAKLKDIQNSRLPESEKAAYVARLLGEKADDLAAARVPFAVWANHRNLRQSVRIGMLAYPKAKDVASATFAEWDEIFKDF